MSYDVMRCAIWYHLYKLKTLENTHGEVLLLLKLQALSLQLTKSNTPLWVFLNYTNGTKSCKTLHILQSRLLDYSIRSQCTFLYSLKTENLKVF